MTLTPLQSAVDVLDRAGSLLLAADAVPDPLVADDMRRFALAQGVAALDTYLHWAIADVPLKNMASALKSLDVPFEELISLSEAVVANRDKIRPKVRARGALERVILTMTFQSSRGVEQAMAFLGIRKAFAKISPHMVPAHKPSDVKERLNRIVHRRNQIVHEGDLQRQSRPQSIKREPADKVKIGADLAWLRMLVLAVDAATP
ncbi:hypothetical protein L5G28_08500 [Gordonia sp. HY285]|uniref:hypothetical protein n=1 Tax=Gordonia liuliyuniae TaxID=2911517 RepID=UPI001F4758DA|nr:hypothetical protein [Gordonia liuliyuniae]MCF8610197.1 hypothetical protein [Gordonia liuliyuniae]